MRVPVPQDIREDIRFGPLTLTAALWVFGVLVLGGIVFVFYPFGGDIRTRLLVSFLPAVGVAFALVMDAPLWVRRAAGYLRRVRHGCGFPAGTAVPGEVWGEFPSSDRAVLAQVLPFSWEARPEAERSSAVSAWRSALRLAAAEGAAVTVFAESVPDLHEEEWARQEALARSLGGSLGVVAAARVAHHRRRGLSGSARRVVYTVRLSGIGPGNDPVEVAGAILPELEALGEACLIGADLAGFVPPGRHALEPDTPPASALPEPEADGSAVTATRVLHRTTAALAGIRLPDLGAVLAERRKARERERVNANANMSPAGIVVAVLGASGGVGRSTVAANIAAALAAMGRRVSALDLCHGAPALADYLGLRSYAPGRWEALAHGETPAVVLVPGGVEGVRVLPGPTLAEREALLTVSADAVARLIQQLRMDDDYIVLDCPADPLDAFTKLAVSEASALVFVADAGPAALRRLGQALTGPWAGGGQTRCLVVTRARPDLGRDAETVFRELAVRPNLVLADAPQTYWPSAAGQPVALSDTEEGRAWMRLAERINGVLLGTAVAKGA